MAVGAHVVPGLVAPGPVQPIAGRQPLVRIEVEPALAALLLRAAVPGDAERLIAAAGQGDQILLQRIDAERVGDRVVVQRPVGAVGAHHEPVAGAEERRGDAEVLELRVGEVAQHRRRRRRLHGQRVMRALPGSELCRMAAGAGLRADEAGRLVRARAHAGCEHQDQQPRTGMPTSAHVAPNLTSVGSAVTAAMARRQRYGPSLASC